MSKQNGQAMIEYILIFGFISLIAVGMAKYLGSYFGGSMGSLAHVLTQQLTIGACSENCFHTGFQNLNL